MFHNPTPNRHVDGVTPSSTTNKHNNHVLIKKNIHASISHTKYAKKITPLNVSQTMTLSVVLDVWYVFMQRKLQSLIL